VPAVVDRWCLSEAAYGSVYRDGPCYDTVSLAQEAIAAYNPTFILCTTENAISTHNRMKEQRREMYEDISPVITKFNDLVATGQYGNYHVFDYDKVNVNDFVDAIMQTY
jgi:hypothetical protein